MIHEYAIEPSVLLEWADDTRDYAEFFREYGLGTPRVLSSFPQSKWRKLRSYLLEKTPANDQSLQSQRYIEMIKSLGECIAEREVQPLGDSQWQDYVKVVHNLLPFDVILSSTLISVENNITPETMYDLESVWNHQNQMSISRTTEGLNLALSGFVRLTTKNVILIDPYGATDEGLKEIKSLINQLDFNRVNHRNPSVILYYKNKHDGRDAVVVRNDLLEDTNVEQAGGELKVFCLEVIPENDVFHNRCILTEHGGIMWGHGLTVTGNEAHTDDVALMGKDIYDKKWRQFVENNVFDIASEA